MIVKKLVEEDEFKPKVKKSPLDDPQIQMSLKNDFKSSLNKSESEKSSCSMVSGLKLPVEIIGFNKATVSSQDANGVEFDDDANKDTVNDFDFRLQPVLVPASKKPFLQPKEVILDENNYLKIIDNLTNGYSVNCKLNQSKKSILKDFKSNDYIDLPMRSLNSSELLNELGLNLDQDPKVSEKIIKTLEKKYKNIISVDSNAKAQSTNSSTNSNSNQPHINLKSASSFQYPETPRSNRRVIERNSKSCLNIITNNDNGHESKSFYPPGSNSSNKLINNSQSMSVTSSRTLPFNMKSLQRQKTTFTKTYVQMIKRISPVTRTSPTMGIRKTIVNNKNYFSADNSINTNLHPTSPMPDI